MTKNHPPVNPGAGAGLPRAGVSEAGVFEAGKLVQPTPDMRLQACRWLVDRMDNAQGLFHDSLSICQTGHARDVDYIILAQAHQNRLVILWATQCMGLVELSERFDAKMTMSELDASIVRHAEDVARRRRERNDAS